MPNMERFWNALRAIAAKYLYRSSLKTRRTTRCMALRWAWPVRRTPQRWVTLRWPNRAANVSYYDLTSLRFPAQVVPVAGGPF